MRCKLLSAILASGLTVAAGTALADEPILLTDGDMDRVIAGATAVANGAAVAIGDLLAETLTASNVSAEAGVFATAANETSGLATSIYFLPASVNATSSSAASLP